MTPHAPATLIVLSGHAETLRATWAVHLGGSAVRLVLMDEKAIIRARTIIRELRTPGQPAVGFGCKQLELQRYQFVLNTYLLFATGRRKFILDETGSCVEFSPVRYFTRDLPSVLLELAASGVVLLTAYLTLRLRLLVRVTPR